MDLAHVLFRPNGRIGQNAYWIGILIVIAANVLLTWIPVLGFVIWLALIYVGAVVAAKRLHDAGKSGWLHLVPWAVSISLTVLAFIAAGGAFFAGLMAALSEPGGFEALEAGEPTGEQIASLVAGGAGSVLLFLFLTGLSMLVWIVYTIWVGLLEPDPGPNRFGDRLGAAMTARSEGKRSEDLP